MSEIKVAEVESREDWNAVLESVNPRTFLQSWEWGEFNKALGSKIWRLGVFEDRKLTGIALAVKVEARRGLFLFVPHGPIMNWSVEELGALVKELRRTAHGENVAFIRIAPSEKKSEWVLELFRKFGFRASPIHTHAELSWLLDLLPSEEELLKGMRKQTRYSVQKAGKDGVEIEMSADPEDIDRFYKVYATTAKEQQFHPFSLEYIEKEFKAFALSGNAKFFFAHYKGDIVSTALVIFSKDEAFYHHGASTKKYPQLTASHFLQWGIIREAKRRGCRIYNFWGISPPEQTHHPWAGLSLFKRGFGGYVEEFVPSQDLPISHRYWLNFAVEKIRKFRRGF